jgi:membrane-associated phospholipid phosphatase
LRAPEQKEGESEQRAAKEPCKKGEIENGDPVLASNSIPSMHVSMSTLTAIHLCGNLYPALGSYDLLVFAFPAMIAFSAVFAKQHYIADLPSGAVFGWLAYRAAEFILVA